LTGSCPLHWTAGRSTHGPASRWRPPSPAACPMVVWRAHAAAWRVRASGPIALAERLGCTKSGLRRHSAALPPRLTALGGGCDLLMMSTAGAENLATALWCSNKTLHNKTDICYGGFSIGFTELDRSSPFSRHAATTPAQPSGAASAVSTRRMRRLSLDRSTCMDGCGRRRAGRRQASKRGGSDPWRRGGQCPFLLPTLADVARLAGVSPRRRRWCCATAPASPGQR
jgi:hypothetical protein